MRTTLLFLALALRLPLPGAEIKLAADQLKLLNVTADEVTYKGKKAIRLTDVAPPETGDARRLAHIPGTDFTDGTIEFELTGDTLPGTSAAARGFAGLAFRLKSETDYECFYLRPKNGRADNQEQRNHSAQYIAPPDYPWQRLRKETPERYESYVDLVPGEWTKVRIEVKGDKARLYVHGSAQPTLMVNDLKHGVSKGSLALWIGPGTVAHFANLRVTPQ